MEWVVTVGRTVDEAKDAALDQLGVDEEDAEFEILEEPKPGLFGRIRGEARVRARIRPTVPRPKVERRDKRRRGSSSSSSSSNGKGKGRGGRGREQAPATDGATDAAAEAEETGAGAPEAPVEAETQAAGGGRGPQGRGRGRRGGQSASGAAKTTTADRDDVPAASGTDENEANDASAASTTSPGGADMSENTLTLEEQSAIVVEFLDGLLDAFGTEGQTTVERVDDENVEIRVDGDDLGLLIGPKGNTLSAVQELSRTVVQRRAAHAEGRVRIDIGGYRQRRREALERFTIQVAEDVKSSGVQKALEPMHPADRKVVHDVANTIDGVRTVSEGEEPRRRVVIIPD